MRVCLFGPSGSGKTTAARVVAAAVAPRLPLVSGDTFIKRESEDLENLEQVLRSHDSFIFEHISAPLILQKLNIPYDLALGIAPTLSKSSVPEPDRKREHPADHHGRATRAVVSSSAQLIETTDARETILAALRYLHQINGSFPPPLANFVIKIASRCNLNCSYCYMYKGTDSDWRNHPAVMAESTASCLGARIAEHTIKNPSLKPTLIIHGGEPLTLPTHVLRRLITRLTEPLAAAPYDVVVQTNGTTITDDYLDVLDQLGVFVGISTDGASEAGNAARLYHSGASAHAAIEEGLRRCISYHFQHGRFGGVLCVVDPSNDGRNTYQHFRALGVSAVDFLLRDGHYGSVPSSLGALNGTLNFLIDAFDAWVADTSPCDVRLFRTLICLLLGSEYSTDYISLRPPNDVCVSVNGDWELLDVLRICFAGAWRTGCNVRDHSLADVVKSPAFEQALNWKYDLSDTCLKCPYLIACGGGYLPHRYRQQNGFRNPSVYCATLYGLIDHIQARLVREGVLRV